MFKKLFSFLDKKTKIQILSIQFIFILTTILEFLNLNFLLAFLISIFSKNKFETSVPFFDFLNFKIFNSYNTSEIGIFLVIIFFLCTTFILLSNFIIFYYSNFLKAKLTNTYFLRSLDADYFYILDKGVSGIIHDVNNEIPKISDGVILPILKILNKLFLLIAILFFLLTSFFNITIKLLFISIIMIFIFYIVLKKYFYDFGQKVSISQNNVLKSLHDTFSNIQTIKIFKIEKFFVNKVFYNLKIYSKYQSLGYLFGGIPKFFFELLSISLVTFVLIYFSKNSQIEIENIIPAIGTFAFVGYRLLPIFQEIFHSLSIIKNSQYSTNRILNKNLFQTKSKKIEKYKIFNSKIDKIQINSLSFKYPKTTKYIFKNFSVSFEKNKITTITGKSGTGKTTLMNILNGLIVPQKIKFKVNGKEVSNKDYYKIIKSKFSYNDQRPNLFDTSIRNNITLEFDNKIYKKNKFIKSLKSASLFNEINKFNKSVGSGGLKLSGGQIQRLLIARALYHQKNILIYDEPTNFLDQKNKFKIIESIKKIKKDKIIVILSHDKDILKISDKIINIKR